MEKWRSSPGPPLGWGWIPAAPWRTTSSSDRQFFRSAKRGDAAGEVNARYGHDPGLGFYTHISDQHGPYSVRVMSATSHEARGALYAGRSAGQHGDVFTFRVTLGRAGQSYGARAAALAGLPPSVLARAEALLATYNQGLRHLA